MSVADGCVADGHVFCKQDPRKKQRLAFGSLIDLNRRSGARRLKSSEETHRQRGKGGEKDSGAHDGLGGGWNCRREALRRRFD
jgi:hypothetical protein